MKPYVVVTGTLFSLFALVHIWQTAVSVDRLSTEPGLVAGRAAIALVAVGFAVWAWVLLARSRSTPA